MRSRMLVTVGAVLALLTLLIPLARSAEASTKSDCEDDPSASITACITQHYDQITDASRTYTRVVQYEFSWTRTDPQVAMNNAVVHVGALGPVLNGGAINKVEDHNMGAPASGQAYTIVPSWHDTYVETDCDRLHCHQCASQEIHLSRGTRGWDFHFNLCTGAL